MCTHVYTYTGGNRRTDVIGAMSHAVRNVFIQYEGTKRQGLSGDSMCALQEHMPGATCGQSGRVKEWNRKATLFLQDLFGPLLGSLLVLESDVCTRTWQGWVQSVQNPAQISFVPFK